MPSLGITRPAWDSGERARVYARLLPVGMYSKWQLSTHQRFVSRWPYSPRLATENLTFHLCNVTCAKCHGAFFFQHIQLHAHPTYVHTHTHKNTHTHTHTLSLSLSLSHTHTHTHTGSGSDLYNESETITKFEIMDGAPVRGESVPVRLFLSGVHTHTYKHTLSHTHTQRCGYCV